MTFRQLEEIKKQQIQYFNHFLGSKANLFLISTNVQQAAAMSRDVVKSLQQPEANEVAWL